MNKNLPLISSISSVFTVNDLDLGVLIPISQPQAVCVSDPEFDDDESFTVIYTYPACVYPNDKRSIVYLVIAKAFSPHLGDDYTSVEIISTTRISHAGSQVRFAID